jgi:fumarate reductase subunit D
MYKINTIEPFWWALFGAGGFIAALLLPAHILVNGLIWPNLGPNDPTVSARRLANLLGNPIVKLYLLALISLPLFHWAHRFRYFLFDLGLHGGRMGIAVLCYGLAVLGTIAAIVVLIGL